MNKMLLELRGKFPGFCLQTSSISKKKLIIGGAQIYQASQHLWDKIYLTRVKTIAEQADAFFPAVDLNHWQLVSSEAHLADQTNKLDHTFELYERVQSTS